MAIVPRVAALLRDRLSAPAFDRVKAAYQAVARPEKYTAELNYWQLRRLRKGSEGRTHYRKRMLNAAGRDIRFFDGMVVCDFGCGPCGSLRWLSGRARLCVGLDALADRYFDAFGADMAKHGMVYVRTTEQRIPLPSGFCDVMFTVNSLDHVDDLPRMCDEIVRVMKPGAWLFAQINLYERRTITEPQTLDADILDRLLFSRFAEDRRAFRAKADASEAMARGPAPTVVSFMGTRL